MAKPICVIYYLPEALFPSGRVEPVSEVNSMFRDWLPDYYTIAIPSRQSLDGSCEDLRLQVFHEKDFTEIQYQELKDLINTELEKLK